MCYQSILVIVLILCFVKVVLFYKGVNGETLVGGSSLHKTEKLL